MNQPFFHIIWQMKIKIGLHLVELEEDNFHLIVASDFGEGKTGNWIIDTGASKTVFDLNRKELYQAEPKETGQAHTVGVGDKTIHTVTGRLHPFLLDRLAVENLKVALLDLSHINRFYSTAAGLQICGLLGSDFLKKYKAVIDYKKKLLKLELKLK